MQAERSSQCGNPFTVLIALRLRPRAGAAMVRRMVRWLRLAFLGALAVTVQACGGGPGADPGVAAQGVLTASQSGDSKAFEAWVDRPAVRAALRDQLIAVARQNGLDVGGPSDGALDRMIGPTALKLVQAGAGTPLAGPPSAAQVAALMKPLDKGRACLHDLTPQQRCLLTFARETPGWRLVAMPAGDVTIGVPAEPRAKG